MVSEPGAGLLTRQNDDLGLSVPRGSGVSICPVLGT